MKKIKTLIVDDEPLAREGLRTMLEQADDIELAGECCDGEEALKAIGKKKPDLVFLDVQMPELDGFGVLQSLEPTALPEIVFVTAYDRYALHAFDVHAIDYLLKPIDSERFQLTLQRVRDHLELKGSKGLNNKLIKLVADLKSGEQPLNRLMVKSRGKIIFLKTDDIDWIEAAGDYVRLHVRKEHHLVRDTITQLAVKLDRQKFIRIFYLSQH
ncbi:MAG: response regulator [Ignavibacteriales bacterium]|nr:response regulator [Ignavibacteriales bacterium]